MQGDLSDLDPLVIFRCKNPECRQVFTPATLMDANQHKVFFECPICRSKYEAHYTDVNALADQEIIMLLERPRMTYKGTRIASS